MFLLPLNRGSPPSHKATDGHSNVPAYRQAGSTSPCYQLGIPKSKAKDAIFYGSTSSPRVVRQVYPERSRRACPEQSRGAENVIRNKKPRLNKSGVLFFTVVFVANFSFFLPAEALALPKPSAKRRSAQAGDKGSTF